jgi:hypothetical protein
MARLMNDEEEHSGFWGLIFAFIAAIPDFFSGIYSMLLTVDFVNFLEYQFVYSENRWGVV